jgi:hypothetical protein
LSCIDFGIFIGENKWRINVKSVKECVEEVWWH